MRFFISLCQQSLFKSLCSKNRLRLEVELNPECFGGKLERQEYWRRHNSSRRNKRRDCRCEEETVKRFAIIDSNIPVLVLLEEYSTP